MIDDRILALCELSQDLLFHKIPSDRLEYYIDNPLTIGKTVAQEFSGCDIFELYSQYGIKVEYLTTGNSKFGVMLRGQAVMGADECIVELYSDSIESLAQYSIYDGLEQLDYNRALQIHLSHEFFHFWEYKNKKSVTKQLDSIETIKLFGFSKKAKINRCSEISAHAFAKELLNLPCLPNLYDYCYLIGTGKMTKESFNSKLSTLKEKLSPKLLETI